MSISRSMSCGVEETVQPKFKISGQELVISNYEKLQIKLRICALQRKGILPALIKLNNADPGSLYRDGQKGAPARGNIGEPTPFYEFGIPAAKEPYDETKHKCPFECYMDGRGHYYLFGPNGSGDFFPTFKINDKLFGLFIIRKKENKYAMTGGMKDDSTDTTFTDAGLREFFEEAYANITDENKEKLCGHLLNNATPQLIYEGVMDDKRNTNHAYGYSCIMNLHFDGCYIDSIMQIFQLMLSHCKEETFGAEIVEITPEFIKNQIWTTHQSTIETVYNYYMTYD
jgi:hypothetical protein